MLIIHVSFHWFTPVVLTTLELILCKMFLLTMPISDLDGNMSLHVRLLLQFVTRYGRRTCSVVKHVSEHLSLKFMLIDQNNVDLRKCENFWIRILLTNLEGLNCTHDFSQQ